MRAMIQANEQRLQLAAQIKQLGERQSKWTAEDRHKWDAMNADYDRLYGSIAAQAGRDNGIMSLIGRDGATLDDEHDPAIRAGDYSGGIVGKGNTADAGAALGAWLKFGVPGARMSAAEDRAAQRLGATGLVQNQIALRPFNTGLVQPGAIRAALGTQSIPGGGALTTESFANQIEIAMSDIGGMMAVSETFVTSTGGEFKWPGADDTASEGVQVGESTDVETDDAEPFALQIWRDYKYSSKIIKVSYELLEDSALPLERILARLLGERLGRIQSRRFTVGTGASQPRGIVTAAAAGVTAASQTAIAADEVIDLVHSVDQSRRNMPGVAFMMNDAILQYLRKLKDGNGAYLWQPSLALGQPDRIHGYPYIVNPYMTDTIATGNTTMLFGQLSQYKIRRVNELRFRRLNERYADTDEVGFIALIRADGNLLSAGDNPVKKLVQA